MADDDSQTVEGAPQAENTCAGCGLPAKMACPHCVKIKASEPQDFTTDLWSGLLLRAGLLQEALEDA